MPNLTIRRSGVLGFLIAGLALCIAAPSVEAASGGRLTKHGGVFKQTGTANPVRRRARIAPAKAAPQPSKQAVAPSAATLPTEPARTWTTAEPGERACFRGRRKLWQAGEGWVVKRVNLCP